MSNKSVGLIWIKAAGNSATETYKELRVCRGRPLLTPLRCFHWDWMLCALCRREHSGEIGVGRAGSQRTNPRGPFCLDFGSVWAAWGGGLGTAKLCCDPKLSEVIIHQLVDPVFSLVPLQNDTSLKKHQPRRSKNWSVGVMGTGGWVLQDSFLWCQFFPLISFLLYFKPWVYSFYFVESLEQNF